LAEAKWAPIARWEQDSGGVDPARDGEDRTSGSEENARPTAGRHRWRSAATDRTISAPVFGYDGTLVCALTALGWRGELSLSPDSETSRKLIATSEKLSRTLGFREDAGRSGG